MDDCIRVMGCGRTRNPSPSSRKLEAEFDLHNPEPVGDEQRQIQAGATRYGHAWSQLCAFLRRSVAEGDSVFLSLFDQPDGSKGFVCRKQPAGSVLYSKQPWIHARRFHVWFDATLGVAQRTAINRYATRPYGIPCGSYSPVDAA